MAKSPDYIEHAENEKIRLFRLENDEIAGDKSGNTAGHMERTAAATIDAMNSLHDQAEQQAKNRFNDIMFMAMINELENAVSQGEQDLARMEMGFEAKYGKDWDQDFYEKHFGDRGDDLTKEERLDQLASIYLDENGNLKPEFADSPLGAYLAKRYDVDEMRRLIDSGQYEKAQEYAKENGMSAVAEGVHQDKNEALKATMIDEGLSRHELAKAAHASTGSVKEVFTISSSELEKQEEPAPEEPKEVAEAGIGMVFPTNS